jgi:hypothetical protein
MACRPPNVHPSDCSTRSGCVRYLDPVLRDKPVAEWWKEREEPGGLKPIGPRPPEGSRKSIRTKTSREDESVPW